MTTSAPGSPAAATPPVMYENIFGETMAGYIETNQHLQDWLERTFGTGLDYKVTVSKYSYGITL